MEKAKTVPRLRFPGYTDDWEQRKLDDMCSLITKQTGFDYSATIKPSLVTIKSDDTYPFIQNKDFEGESINLDTDFYIPTEVAKRFPKITLDTPSLLISISGKIGNVGYYRLKDKAFIGGAVGICKLLEDNGRLLVYALQSDVGQAHFHSLIKASSHANITVEDIRNIEIHLPKSQDEYITLEDFFFNLDQLITLYQRNLDTVKQYKQGILQKMFPKEGEKVPEIRFPGFTDDWEQRKLGSICERVTRKNKNCESDLPLTIASQYGLIDQRNFFNKVVAAKDMTNYYLLKRGEFAYNKSYSNGFDYGSIKRLNAYEQGCLSTLYICFALVSDDVSSDYLECYFDTLRWYDDVSQICAEGARNHGLLNVDTKAFFDDVSISMPSTKTEQKQIATFLDNLDNIITLHQRKLDQMKLYKQGLLQQMFV